MSYLKIDLLVMIDSKIDDLNKGQVEEILLPEIVFVTQLSLLDNWVILVL